MNRPDNGTDTLLLRAERLGRPDESFFEEMAVLVFPKTKSTLSEQQVSEIRQVLYFCVRDIEREIIHLASRNSIDQEMPRRPASSLECQSWPMLVESGLLTDREILSFAFARAMEHSLENSVSANSELNSLHPLLDHSNPKVADLAMALMVTQSKNDIRYTNQRASSALPSHLLHLLAWRIVAALQMNDGQNEPLLSNAAKELLASYDEGANGPSRATQLAQLLDKPATAELSDHMMRITGSGHFYGVSMFIATLATRSAMAYDDVVVMMVDENLERLTVLLRATGLNAQFAVETLINLRAFLGYEGIYALTAQEYSQISVDAARTLLNRWKLDREYFVSQDRIADASALEFDR